MGLATVIIKAGGTIKPTGRVIEQKQLFKFSLELLIK